MRIRTAQIRGKVRNGTSGQRKIYCKKSYLSAANDCMAWKVMKGMDNRPKEKVES